MATVDTSDFFTTQRDTSDIKSQILNDFFRDWCNAILQGQRYKSNHMLAYIDLYAGEGKYEDGKTATPVKILNSIFGATDRFNLNKIVRTFFTDEKPAVTQKLKHNLEALPYYENLIYKPVILNEELNFTLLAKLLGTDTPALMYTDPFGYTFSQQMLLQSVKRWGLDVFMLFSPAKMRPAILNATDDDLTTEIFGAARIAKIKEFCERYQDAGQREDFMVDSFEDIFKEKDYKTFRFKISLPKKNQTSHYLFFVSKTDTAYMKMKELMLSYSDFQEDGVPLFGANIKHQLSLFQEQYRYSIKNLIAELSGSTAFYNNLPLDSIYRHHNIGTNYIRGNYLEAFEVLRKDGLIEAINPISRKPMRKVSFSSIISYK
ncbi:three-Cys-motif partner protein [Pontibacter aydingkolensis]|uniref:Three-Cys-motif partner protein TcmP n=1 Tax=Pontibacter aydingkolensis TaxID=1911536 RepID=A0ABS7CZB2_9BACT|nr:three-Cys-motif partner protein TcmP [Pontibacter aydingkolensis]MBW7469153.1 three-Cys-motif partner protein TcmP [Pontibacter aydingkolensis]